MIKISEVVKFIENKNNIKLFDFQIRFLDNLIHGKTTRVSRNFGKTMLIKGYADYLNWIEDTGYLTDEYEYDDFISGQELIRVKLLDKKRLKEQYLEADNKHKELFNREYCLENIKV